MTFKSVPVRLAGTLFLCLLLFGQAGCFQRHDRADFTVINGPDPEALDPAIITSQADGRIVSAMFEGLTRFNAVTAQAEPALAKRCRTNPSMGCPSPTGTATSRSGSKAHLAGISTAHDVTPCARQASVIDSRINGFMRRRILQPQPRLAKRYFCAASFAHSAWSVRNRATTPGRSFA